MPKKEVHCRCRCRPSDAWCGGVDLLSHLSATPLAPAPGLDEAPWGIQFTGAFAAKPGIMEVAHRGTMFHDEIGDMYPLIQPKLFKVLEEKQLRRIGDLRNRVVDIQLIAAKHRDLATLEPT
jgi:Mg-chelatase subunit ChlI